jgi:CRP-like cAMP-binding protein
MTAADRIALLRSVGIFADLDAFMLDEVARDTRSRTCAAGAAVFSEGERCRHLHILASGRVKFSRINADGREQVLRVFERAGDLFCLASAFGSAGAHIVTGTAAAPSELLLLDLDLLRDLAGRHPSVGLKLMGAAGEHLRHLVDLAGDLALKSATSRLAKHLLVAAESAAGSAGARLRRQNFRQDELAAALGTVRVNVSRGLANLARAGAITLERDVIVIKDLNILRRMAEAS